MLKYFDSFTVVVQLSATLTLLTAFLVRDQPSLEIKILNVSKKGGKIIIEIYNDKTSWLKTPYRRITLPVGKDTQTASFEIDYGQYAISVYHDANDNNKLDTGIFGIPKEDIGFGNNYKPFGKPKFEDAAVDFKATSKVQEIKLFSVF